MHLGGTGVFTSSWALIVMRFQLEGAMSDDANGQGPKWLQYGFGARFLASRQPTLLRNGTVLTKATQEGACNSYHLLPRSCPDENSGFDSASAFSILAPPAESTPSRTSCLALFLLLAVVIPLPPTFPSGSRWPIACDCWQPDTHWEVLEKAGLRTWILTDPAAALAPGLHLDAISTKRVSRSLGDVAPNNLKSSQGGAAC